MPQPNGYRKALRFMKHADHFGFPIVTFVDTPGAYAGKNAEELGQVGTDCRIDAESLDLEHHYFLQQQTWPCCHDPSPERQRAHHDIYLANDRPVMQLRQARIR